ncbi:MAG: hypothetical protein GY880_13790 [Planctomycetaceae bacterium]|nr:hypothetical protein [Planctomycetaceae bacterium]
MSSNPLSTMDNLMVSTVYGYREAPASTQYITKFEASPNRLYVPADTSTEKRIVYVSGNTIETTSPVELNTNHLSTLSVDSTTAVGYYDGEKYTKNDAAAISDALTLAQPSVGSFGGSSYSNSVIQEILIYNTDQSATRQVIETNINRYYGIISGLWYDSMAWDDSENWQN